MTKPPITAVVLLLALGSGEVTTWYDRHSGQWHRVVLKDDGRHWETLLASIAIPER